MKTINQLAEHLGTRLPARTATASTWRRPIVFGGFYMIDNSTDVSAGKRRHR